jgi:hypothetical protein
VHFLAFQAISERHDSRYQNTKVYKQPVCYHGYHKELSLNQLERQEREICSAALEMDLQRNSGGILSHCGKKVR